MNWKSILPREIDIKQLNFDQCRTFKQFYAMLTESVGGPPGYQIFYRFSLHLLLYGLCCLDEKKFPALNRCRDALAPHFLTPAYDNAWLVFFWIFCDFPLTNEGGTTVLDHFDDFMAKEASGLSKVNREHVGQFVAQLKASRLGFYQEISSTSKTTKFRELFTNRVISTVRSVPDYGRGEIFVGRIVAYLGDAFLIHDPRNFPAEYKDSLENMIRNKLFYIFESGNDSKDYERFMKLAGPYLMSVTHNDQDCPIFDPDEYATYHLPSRK